MSEKIKVTLYKSDPCGYCRAAIRFLKEVKGVDPAIVDLTGDYEARMKLVQTTGSRTVPQIYVGNVHIGGYDEMRALDASGGLDQLLGNGD